MCSVMTLGICSKAAPCDRIGEGEEITHLFVWQNIDRMEERKANIYSKKNGGRRVKIKGNMKGWRNCKVKG